MDAGKSSKTVPFDKITYFDITEEPAGNSCLCINNVLCTVNVDTASSNQAGHELVIAGLKDAHTRQKLVWTMKYLWKETPRPAPPAFEMVDCKINNHENGQGESIASLLRNICDELLEFKAIKKEKNIVVGVVEQPLDLLVGTSQEDHQVSSRASLPTNP